jgi:hypothetical protein
MSSAIIPPSDGTSLSRTTTSDCRYLARRSLNCELDSDTATRVALAYGLILLKLFDRRRLLERLSQIGITGHAAADFIDAVTAANVTT